MTWTPFVETITRDELLATQLLALLNEQAKRNEAILCELRLLNERIEEAFQTGIDKGDVDAY